MVKKIGFDIVTISTPPTLEDLRKHAAGVWLWDGARGRIVWANAAGVAYFGGQSVFDLVDRPFDTSEPGVERIMALAGTLARGQSETGLLHFPSSGHAAPMVAKCTVHALADGRAGILVIDETAAAAKTPDLPPERLTLAFDQLPLACGFVGDDGSLHHLNAAARRLLLEDQRSSLAAVMAQEERAGAFLTRLATAGLVSDILTIPTVIGARDVRFTLRRLSEAKDPLSYAVMLLDDITDRRALERQLFSPGGETAVPESAPQLAPAEAEAFHNLGKVLTAGQTPPLSKPAEDSRATPPRREKVRRKQIDLPALVRTTLERIGEPIVIVRNGLVLFANPKALEIFGYASVEDLINDDAVWALFTSLDHDLAATDLKLCNGRHIALSAKRSNIAWLNGPALQFSLKVGETVVEDRLTDYLPAPQPVPLPQPKAPPEAEAPKPAPPSATPVAPALPASLAPAAPPAEVRNTMEARSASVADDELRAILDTATDGLITLDKAGHIHTFSAGAEAIFGYRIAEVMDKPFGDLLTPESRKVLRDYLAALQGPGLASVFNDGREVSAVVKQGGTVPLFLTIGPLQSKASKAAFCAVVRDITQWKRTESELREAKEVAEAMSRQKSEFLARISHELRTPLNAIMGFSEVMRLERFGEIKNEKYRGYVNDIHASGGLLLSLINDLLDLSKVEAGQLELNFTSVNLSDTADVAIRMLQEAATGARVVIRKSIPADLPNVVADQRSMRQIMLNVISNAIKFTDPGGQVIVSALLNKAGELKLRIKDTGIGMNADQLKDALEPFKRVVTSGREAQGTGLGLPLTKALAEANRTTFAISSEPRKGTMVEITFPTTRVLAD
jgi:PAS domain S-box-containing protein